MYKQQRKYRTIDHVNIDQPRDERRARHKRREMRNGGRGNNYWLSTGKWFTGRLPEARAGGYVVGSHYKGKGMLQRAIGVGEGICIEQRRREVLQDAGGYRHPHGLLRFDIKGPRRVRRDCAQKVRSLSHTQHSDYNRGRVSDREQRVSGYWYWYCKEIYRMTYNRSLFS